MNFVDPFGLDPGGALSRALADATNLALNIVIVPIDSDQTDIEKRQDLDDLVNPVLSEAKNAPHQRLHDILK